jgi:hypothetical protein
VRGERIERLAMAAEVASLKVEVASALCSLSRRAS